LQYSLEVPCVPPRSLYDMTPPEIFQNTQRQRVSDGALVPILTDVDRSSPLLVLVWPQLGDFDSLEYAGWLHREAAGLQAMGVQVRAIGIGDRAAGEKFCVYTGFPATDLFLDPTAELHRQLALYPGLGLKVPGLSATQTSWLNLLLMCAGLGSPGTLAEVLRGYRGDRQAPQLIAESTVVKAGLLPALTGRTFNLLGQGFQRPFELATLRLRNMTEVLTHWPTYVPNGDYLTQRGATFLFDRRGALIYEHRDRGILGFAANMSQPLSFLNILTDAASRSESGSV
jgi:AhpC/TSA antioxidant enzyme